MQPQNIKTRVEAKCDHLVNSSFWPSEDLRFRSWLNNFDAVDVQAAAKILDHFVFLNREYARHAVVSTYRRYLRGILGIDIDVPANDQRIREHHNRVFVTPVLGEVPNPADSGFGYARLARDHMRIPGDHVVDLPHAIGAAERGEPVVLLDDFCGTGQQLLNTLAWEVNGRSLHALGNSTSQVSCITVVATSYATKRVRKAAPGVQLLATHGLESDEYSVQSLLPEAKHPEVHALIAKFAPQLKVPDHVDPFFGFHGLGLLVGIDDSIPDASLPLLWAGGPGEWTPLMERKS